MEIELYEILMKLVNRLDAVTNSPSYNTAFQIASIHGHKYIGPSYNDIVDDARILLNRYEEKYLNVRKDT